MIGTDTHNDVHPAPYPSMGNSFHVVCLVTIAPLRLTGVTGSPVNPIAAF